MLAFFLLMIQAGTAGFVQSLSVNEATNAQFVVRGIVYEDTDGDGIQDAYVFFDAVTVKDKTIEPTAAQRATAGDQQSLLSMTITDIEKAKLPGRIISTTREQYNALLPQTDTQGIHWCTVLRQEYKKAMRAGINYLIIAWVKGNRNIFNRQPGKIILSPAHRYDRCPGK